MYFVFQCSLFRNKDKSAEFKSTIYFHFFLNFLFCLLSAYYVLCSNFVSVRAGNCPRLVLIWRGDTYYFNKLEHTRNMI